MRKQPSIVALVPARSGSKRLAGKNVRMLAGHPLMAYTIAAARESGIFSQVVVSTDSSEYAAIARHYGAEAPFLRPANLSGDTSPDIEWVRHALETLRANGKTFDCFSILRPTSPFRQADTIRRAWAQFLQAGEVDSIRAVEKCKQHPGKMWLIREGRLRPMLSPDVQQSIFGLRQGSVPWHSSQYQALPEVYVQNASLEMAWTRVVLEYGTIAGEFVVPFLTQGYEGFDVNHPYDWKLAEDIIAAGEARLPGVNSPPCST